MSVDRRLILTAAILLATATGCSDSTAAPSPDPSASSAATPSPPTPSPSPTTEAELAAANAESLVRDYYAVTDGVAQDPSGSLAKLKTVATSVNLTVQQTEYRRWRDDGLRQTGATSIAALEIQDVDLDNTDPSQGVVPTVQVDVCYDVADVDVVDEDGESVVGPDRPARGWERLWVSNYDYDDDPDGAWRVADGKTLEREPCAVR
jgi:hypothetical protein